MIIPALFGIALLAAITWGVARLTRENNMSSGRTAPLPPPNVTADEILQRRYASGEIDAQTFENMRERIAGGRPPDLSPPDASS